MVQGMNSVPENLSDDLQLLKQMLVKMQSRVGFLKEEDALLPWNYSPATPSCALPILISMGFMVRLRLARSACNGESKTCQRIGYHVRSHSITTPVFTSSGTSCL